MHKLNLQTLLSALYTVVAQRLLPRSRFFQSLFSQAYFAYKRCVEDPLQNLCRHQPSLFRGGHILDIGANIGYTTRLLGEVCADPYQVIAFEPGALNFRMLCANLRGPRRRQNFITEQAAVGREDGFADLLLSRQSHADHRIKPITGIDAELAGRAGERVPLVSIDNFLARCFSTRRPVCFVKIDVQGYELAVLEGMGKTLAENEQLALAVEIAPEQIASLGFKTEDIIKFLVNAGFSFSLLTREGPPQPMAAAAIVDTATRMGYCDILCQRQR